MSDRSAASGFSGVVPVFPLPELVFFPDALLPLHVFEPRYVEMTREVLACDGNLVVATLLPGWEHDPEGSPAFHPVATVGRVIHSALRPDGKYDIVLVGLERVALEETYTDRPFRSAQALAMPDRPLPHDRPDVDERLERLFLAFRYAEQLADDSRPLLLPGAGAEGRAREAVIHAICQNAGVPVVQRLRALEADGPLERSQMAAEWMRLLLDARLADKGLPRLRLENGETN